MDVRARDEAVPFTTADGSTIRSLLDVSVAPVRNQSLAEATLDPGDATARHYHARSEELYYLLDGEAEMEVEGQTRTVRAGDAILIPAGSWHQIRATGETPLRFLCCCAPPYSDDDTFFAPPAGAAD